VRAIAQISSWLAARGSRLSANDPPGLHDEQDLGDAAHILQGIASDD
jgi:hypothetical protein